MGRQIVKQPNGLYAQWSSVVDDFTLIDATKADMIADFVEAETARIHAQVSKVIETLESGGKPYNQFTMTWEECLSSIREVHGNDTESLRLIAGSKPQ